MTSGRPKIVNFSGQSCKKRGESLCISGSQPLIAKAPEGLSVLACLSYDELNLLERIK